MKVFAAATVLSLLAVAACDSPEQTEDISPGQPVTDRSVPSDPDESKSDTLTAQTTDQGGISSYEANGRDRQYDNVFRRDPSDADTGPDNGGENNGENFPYQTNPGQPADLKPDSTGSYEVTDATAGESPYGSARATPADAKADQAPPGGGNQAALGATGTENEGTGEDKNPGDTPDAGGDQGSFFRPLEEGAEAYPEDVIQLGPRTDPGADLDARYADLTKQMYAVPDNQQKVVYAPNEYTYAFFTDWNARPSSAQTDSTSGAPDVTVDVAPTYGSGCEKDEDPVGCSTANLDADLKATLNNPTVIDAMQRSGASSVVFDLDTEGAIIPGSVRVAGSKGACRSDDCRRLGNTIGRALAANPWAPAQRVGFGAAGARVTLPLNYTPPEVEEDPTLGL